MSVQLHHVAVVAADPEASVRRSAVRALGEIGEANQAIPAATRARIEAAARPVVERALQDDDKDVTLGTVSSAPRGAHMLKTVIRTTVVSVLIVAIFYGITKGLGYSFDDIPRFVPKSD